MTAQTIGYLRVSTADQDVEKNKADILTLANHHNLGQVKFLEEKVSGKISWHKRKIAQIIEDLKKGDSLIVSCNGSRLKTVELAINAVLGSQ